MKRVVLLTFFAVVLCFTVARNSWAVAITYVSGEIFATAENTIDISGTPVGDVAESLTEQGFAASGDVTVNNNVSGLGTTASANGVKLNGTGADEDVVRFSLFTSTDISNQTPGDAIREMTATSIVRSGENPGDALTFQFTANKPGEFIFDPIQLDVTSIITGVLKSTFGGVSTVDFEFSILTEDGVEVISFKPDQFFNNTLTSNIIDTDFGTKSNDTFFKVGDIFQVVFEQKAFASATYDPDDPFTMSLEELGIPGLEGGQGASGFAFKSTTDLFSFSIEASTIPYAPVPEPSTMILIGIGLTGLGIARLRKRRKKV